MFVELTPEQQRIIALARDLAKEFAPRAEQHDREGSFPYENIARLKETGYTAMTTPKEYGGWGVDPFTFILAQEQLVQGCCATAFAINMHLNSVGFYTPFMTAAQKAQYLENVGRKQMLLNGFYTEGGGARSILSPNTKSRKVPGGYRINGQKVFCTLSPVVDYFGISTSLEDYKGSSSGGCVFLLPRDAPGLEVIENWDAMGMRATGSHTITIRDVFAAQDQLIGEEGHFFEEFVKVAHWYCLSFSAIYVGIGLVLLLAFVIAARLVARFAGEQLRVRHVRPDLVVMARRVLTFVIIILGVFAALGFAVQNANVPLLGLLLATVIAAFGVQDLLKDYVSGYYVLLERHIRVGDRISADVFSGTVTDVRLRVSLLRNDQGDVIVVPNSELFTKPITIHNTTPEQEAKKAPQE